MHESIREMKKVPGRHFVGDARREVGEGMAVVVEVDKAGRCWQVNPWTMRRDPGEPELDDAGWNPHAVWWKDWRPQISREIQAVMGEARD